MRRMEWILIAVLAVFSIALAWQNHQLKSIVNRMPAKPRVLSRGEIVPPIVFTTNDGKIDSLNYNASNLSCWVLAILKPTCPACRKALPVWEELGATIPSDASIFAVSTYGGAKLDSLIMEEAFSIPVGVVRQPSTFSEDYRVSGVPLTMVLSRRGRVEGAWLGFPNSDKKKEILGMVAKCTGIEG